MADDFPQILASDTTVVNIPATEAIRKTYDRWWIRRMVIQAPDPNGIVNASFVMVKGFKNADGSWELSTLPEDTKNFVIQDIFTKALTDAGLGQVLGGLLVTIDRIGHEMNIL